ncbi:CaiB/BaiF CoA transferase family protein [Phaeobacter italicus]|uniref:CaiB/BaiF CoA transferase family protein n=1 Tax=Phaeobacter italicus TaxID=481446 RepID=UPI00248F12FE|nr:CaiB/BaiF CoA-transferase family protein [Phaeobacter italicus]
MLTRNGPLKGVRVIEMAGIGPAPFAAMHLADMGAEVVRITRPGQAFPLPIEDKHNLFNRSRRSLVLDLRQVDDAKKLWALIERTEILIEGFRPGKMEKLGFGPEAVLARNPALIYGRMTGWGQTGPLAQAAGHDLNYAAIAGAVHGLGEADRPPPAPMNLIADQGGGAMMLNVGILAALTHARATGEGQVVDAAMCDGVNLLMTMQHGLAAGGAWSGERAGDFINGGVAWYRCYETADGKFISIGCVEPQFFTEFLRLTGLSDDPRFADQYAPEAQPAMREALTTLFLTRTQAEWCEVLEGSDACFAPVVPLAEAAAHPHNRARESFVTVGGIEMPAPAPRFSHTPPDTPTTGDAGSVELNEILQHWRTAT